MRMLMLAFMVLWCGGFARGQDISGASGSLLELRKDITNKRIVVSPLNRPTVNSLLEQSNRHLNVLSELSKGRSIPPAYTQSIDEDAAILQIIRSSGKIERPQLEQLRQVNADLRVKADHAELLREAAFDSIEVVVHTMKNGQEVSNYQVWYVKEAYKNDTSKYQTFDRFSSPASRKIPPGKYLIWAQATDGSKAGGEKTPKEFGDGQAKVETDVAAP